MKWKEKFQSNKVQCVAFKDFSDFIANMWFTLRSKGPSRTVLSLHLLGLGCLQSISQGQCLKEEMICIWLLPLPSFFPAQEGRTPEEIDWNQLRVGGYNSPSYMAIIKNIKQKGFGPLIWYLQMSWPGSSPGYVRVVWESCREGVHGTWWPFGEEEELARSP